MPNGADKLNHFVAKVWDATSKSYRPIYIAPDATDKVQGDVKLSDNVDATLTAATGMTAATPAALKKVQDSMSSKLDKEVTNVIQTVKSNVTFDGQVVFSKPVNLPAGSTIEGGQISGSVDTAKKLAQERQIALGGAVTGSTLFDGSQDVTISSSLSDKAVTPGKLDRNYSASRTAFGSAAFAEKVEATELKNEDLDSVYIKGNIVPSGSNNGMVSGYLSQKVGSQYFYAGVNNTCKNKPSGVTSFTLMIIRNGNGSGTDTGFSNPSTQILYSQNNEMYIRQITSFATSIVWSAWVKAVTTSSTSTSWITSTMIQNDAVTADKVNFNYAGSTSKGGAADSAVKLATARSINLAGDVTGGANFDGSTGVTITSNISAGVVGTAELAAKGVTTAKVADAAIGTTQLANASVTNAKLGANAVTTNNIANGTIKNEDLSDEVGTVYVGATEPTASAVKLWVKI